MLLLVIALQFGKTQTAIVNRVFTYLNAKYKVNFELQEFKISPFGKFRAEHFLIKDHHKDTLIYVQHLDGSLLDLNNLKNNTLSFKSVSLNHAWVNDKTYDGDSLSSLAYFSSKFKSNKKVKKPFNLVFNKVTPTHLQYVKTKGKNTIVDFHEISGFIHTLKLSGPNVNVVTDSLSFKDVYGIYYQKLATDFKYSTTQIRFKNTNIQTKKSNLNVDVTFKYQPGDFVNFVNKVKLSATIANSQLSLQDIHCIYPHFPNGALFHIDTKLQGTLNHLKLQQTKIISASQETYLIGNFYLKNSIANRANFEFNSTNAHIEMVPNSIQQIVPDVYRKSIPTNFYGMKQLNFNGDLFLTKQKMIATGGVVTNLGKMHVDGFLDGLSKKEKKIEVKITEARVLKNPFVKDLKNLVFRGNVKGSFKGKNLVMHNNFHVYRLQYKNLKLSNADLYLFAKNKNIKANLSVKDSLLAFKTKVDFTSPNKTIKNYRLDFEIYKAKLAKLFPKSASYQQNLTGTGELTMQQNKNNVLAKGLLDQLQITTASDYLNLNKMNVDFSSEGKDKKMILTSKDLLSLDVEGQFEFTELQKLVENALYKFIPGKKTRTDVKDQTLNFGLEIYPMFLKSITNKIQLHKNVKVSGVLDAKGDKGLIYATIPSFSSKNVKVDSLRIFLDNSNQWINSNISVKKFKFKKQVYDDLSLLGKKVNDTLFVRSNFNTDKIDNRAVFHLTTQQDAITLGIENVYFKYLNSTWINKAQKQNKIRYNYHTKNWKFFEIAFANKEQEFEFEGNVNNNNSKNLKLALSNINLEEIVPGIDSLKVGGIASGEFFFREKNTLLKPDGNLVVKKLKINGVEYGLMRTSIQPNEKKLGYSLNLNITNNQTQNIDAKGEIIVNDKDFLQSQVVLAVLLNNLELSSLSPLGRDVLSAIRGTAKGKFNLSGKLNDFDTHGYINLSQAGLKFPYLNTNYNFSGATRIDLEGKTFVFNKVQLEDDLYKTKGVLKGKINYDKYNNWFLDLRIATNNLLVLNTKPSENARYYGTGFMDGVATIKGPTSGLDINVTGKTLPNTKFVLPLSDVKQAEANRFIYFKELNQEKEKDTKQTVATAGGIHITLNLDITKDALGEIVIDQTSGSSLQGRADGRLLIDIDKYYNLKMFGDLAVDEGLYNFKYSGIVNKPFTVKKGGTISWNGDPYKAELNIEAVHSVKANPKVLLENLAVNRKMDVDLVTKVTGELFDSSQEFLIEIPNASSTVASELDFKLNIDENAKMRQFFSLLVSKSFFDENRLNNTSAVLSNTTSEIISNAVTDIFNNKGDKLQFNFGYTSGETSEVEDLTIDNQIDIGVATEINDRILINGKLGVPVGTKTQSAVVGEVKIEFLLNKEGTLRSSVFNRQNEIQYSQDEQGYTQGLGLNYQINFNNLTEMLQKLKMKNKSKAKREDEVEIKDTLNN